jgi:hydroxymethylbilane synthase
LTPVVNDLPGSDLVPVSGGQADQSLAAVAASYLDRLVGGRGLRLGSRTSPMAMAQARQVAGLLNSLVPGVDVTISGISTTADQWATRRSPGTARLRRTGS